MSAPKNLLLLAIDLDATVGDARSVAEFALAAGTEVEVLVVLAPDLGTFGFRPIEQSDAEPPPSFDRTAANATLTSMTTALEALGIVARSRLVSGPTVETIIERADEIDALAIAIIDRQHGLRHRLLMGSVGQSLLKHSHRPVLVVPAAAIGDTETGLLAAIDRMIHVIDRPEVGGDLADLRSAAEAHRNDPESEANRHQLLDRLRDPAHRFETDHPSLVRAINDVAYYLSGMGL